MPLPRRTLLKWSAAGAVPMLRGFAGKETTPDQIAADRSRPQVHLVAPANRLNYPNGPVYFNGQYHMFYQKGWSEEKHCGHANSRDFNHWKQLQDAITTTKGGPVVVICVSGCYEIDSGTCTRIYPGFRPEVQCIG